MSQKPILLKNATFINEGATSLRDILIKDNRIEKIDNFISADNSYEVMDVSDMLVLPGRLPKSCGSPARSLYDRALRMSAPAEGSRWQTRSDRPVRAQVGHAPAHAA